MAGLLQSSHPMYHTGDATPSEGVRQVCMQTYQLALYVVSFFGLVRSGCRGRIVVSLFSQHAQSLA